MDRLRLPTSLTTGIAHRLPSLRPHTHRPQLRGLRPCPTNFFKFSLLVLNRGSRLAVDSKAAHRQALPPTPWLIDRSRGPCAEGRTGGAAQGVWGRHAPQPRSALGAGWKPGGADAPPRWGGTLWGRGSRAEGVGEPRQGCPSLGTRELDIGRNAKSLKIKDLRKWVRTPAVSGGADTSCVRGCPKS